MNGQTLKSIKRTLQYISTRYRLYVPNPSLRVQPMHLNLFLAVVEVLPRIWHEKTLLAVNQKG